MESFLHIPIGRERIAATLHTPSASPAPLVICCHGLTGTRVGSSYRFVRLARLLAECGIACLRFDFRGCGESEGRFEDVSTDRLLEDLRAVLAAIKDLPGCDADRLGIVGSSFGAFTAARAAAEIPGLRCLVFLAPVADPSALIQRDMTSDAWAFLRSHAWVEHHGHRLGAGFFDGLPKIDVPAILAKARKPLLIFHGVDDRQVPFSQGEAYAAANRQVEATVELVSMPTGDHGMKGAEHTQRIIEGAAAWLRRWLQCEPPEARAS